MSVLKYHKNPIAVQFRAVSLTITQASLAEYSALRCSLEEIQARADAAEETLTALAVAGAGVEPGALTARLIHRVRHGTVWTRLKVA